LLSSTRWDGLLEHQLEVGDLSYRGLPFTPRLDVFLVVKHAVRWAPGTSVAVLDPLSQSFAVHPRLDVFFVVNHTVRWAPGTSVSGPGPFSKSFAVHHTP
jgi:hypothetical protein